MSLRLKRRRLRPGGGSERSPAIWAGCLSLRPRRRSRRVSPSWGMRWCLNVSVRSARGSVAMDAVRTINASVGRSGRPRPPAVTGSFARWSWSAVKPCWPINCRTVSTSAFWRFSHISWVAPPGGLVGDVPPGVARFWKLEPRQLEGQLYLLLGGLVARLSC